MAYQEKSKLLFERLFNICCDGSKISKIIRNRLNATLKEMGHQGLISFCSCSLHIVHNVFKKCIEALEGGRAWKLHITFSIGLKRNHAKFQKFR